MAKNPDFRRRCVGAVFLIIALVMLIVGETALRDKLSAIGFLVYWLACFCFTILAILVAVADLAVTRRRTRKEARDLLQGTIEEIIESKKARGNESSESDNSVE
jgi:membrane protein implicated in regulation of membrane protease activity